MTRVRIIVESDTCGDITVEQEFRFRSPDPEQQKAQIGALLHLATQAVDRAYQLVTFPPAPEKET